jgi:hypothetical protein
MQKIFAMVALGAAVSLAACGKKDEKTVYSNGGATVTQSSSGDHMTITGANGEKVEFGSGSSAKMPSYLPLYPGANITASFSGQGKDGSGGVVTFHTGATPADVISFYKKKAAAAGMTEAMNMESGGTTLFTAANEKAKTTLSVSATKGTDGTDAQVTWGSK